jgi:hypothetical protein
MERETGIEPATNSLEGCDSTTELLPLSLPQRLKPPVVMTQIGTTKVVSFPSTSRTLEPMIRIELMTSPLPRECSTN